MSRQDVAALTVRLGEYNIKQSGETKIFETAAARVVRHKEFTQQTHQTHSQSKLTKRTRNANSTNELAKRTHQTKLQNKRLRT